MPIPSDRRVLSDDPHLILKLDTREPVELGDFVALFTSLGSQFEKFVSEQHPEAKGQARFYVREIRAGSVVAEIVAWVIGGGGMLSGTALAVKNVDTLASFVEKYGGKVRRYFKPGGRVDTASKSDLSDFYKTVAAVAHDPSGSLSLSAAVFEDGERKIRAAFQFGTREAREAERQIEQQREEIDRASDADYKRVLMTFARTNVSHAKAGKKSGDLVTIEAVHPKPLPIVYASDLAEQRVRHEIADADENVYKKGFDVDVNVELRNGRPIAFRLVSLHSVIDLPEDTG